MAHERPWPPETERAFKEVLYRFMGEVHATTAALYLESSDAEWLLATQYGFGRRDRLELCFPGDHALVRMVRAFGEDPRFYNDPSEVGEVAGYLADAGTSRLMLVPLTGQAGLIGFVDVRDKGRQHFFSSVDLDISRAIAASLTQLVEEAVGGESAAAVEPEEPAAAVCLPVEPHPGSSDGPRALLDEAGFNEINAAATEALAEPRVIATALTAASRSSGATLVQQRIGAATIDVDPLLKHQIEAMAQASAPTPKPKGWKTEVRRIGGQTTRARDPVIATAVLLNIGGSCLVGSVVADAEPALARQVLEHIGDRARNCRNSFCLRIARRGLARRLLQPGNRRYPELVAHSLGVSRLCWSIARVLELGDATTEQAALAGLLHDVGMRELDYDRLYMHPTPGPEDRRTYRMHVEVGDRIVRVEGFNEIADAVRHHHERWDGNGYPDRLADETIPLVMPAAG